MGEAHFWSAGINLRDRKRRADDKGHPEWVFLPVSPEQAKHDGKERYYTGGVLRGCGCWCGPQLLDGQCATCADQAARRHAMWRSRILTAFEAAAERMIESGRAQILVGSWSAPKVKDGGMFTTLDESAIRDGWRRAGERSLKEGRLFIAKQSGRRMKLVKVVRKTRV